jgi:hypothetical protein
VAKRTLTSSALMPLTFSSWARAVSLRSQ